MGALILIAACLVSSGAWAARRLSGRLLLGALLLGVGLSVAGVLLNARPYPWTDGLVLLVALSGGIMLGRAIPARFRPFFLLLVILSALDAAQQVLPSGPVSHRSTRPTGYFYTMFVLDVGTAHSAVGFVDLLLAAAIGEHSRRRGQSWWRGVVPAPAGLLLADVFSVIPSAGNIPLIPFITVGWLVAQIPWPRPPVTGRPGPRSIPESSSA